MRIPSVCAVVLAATATVAACSSGGDYVKGGRNTARVDRGETNGRMFDFVSNMPDGDDWQIRVRDSSLWAAYGDGEAIKDLGTANLSGKDASKIWDLIDAVDIAGRDKGEPDEDEGFVEIRLREPPDDEDQTEHNIFKIYVSRADAGDDEEVFALAGELQKLIQKYFKKKPEF